MLSAIRWILVDAVGTLIFPDPPVAEVYFAAGLDYGSRRTVDEIRGRFRAALAAAYSSCLPTSEPLERMRWQIGFEGYADKKVLDFGCGVRFSHAIINSEYDIGGYCGVDVFRPMIDFLQSNVSDPRFSYHFFDAYHPL